MATIKYRIACERIATGEITYGDPKYTLQSAKKVAANLNKDDPYSLYWADAVTIEEDENNANKDV